MRTRALILPRPLSIAILFSFALALVLGAVPVDAAPKGSKIAPTITSLNDVVTPLQVAAFDTRFENPLDNPSTINDLHLRVTAVGGTLLTTALPEGCQRESDVAASCLIGTVSSGAAPVIHSFYVTADNLPAGQIDSVSLTAVYSGDARQDNRQAAKRDTWTAVLDNATVVDPNAEVFGTWQFEHGANQKFGPVGGPFQNTLVNVPNAVDDGYVALVQQVNDSLDCSDEPTFVGFGRAVDLRINDGDSPIQVTITYSVAATENTSPNQIDLVHQLDGTGECVPVTRNCAANGVGANGCFDVTVQGTGQNKLTIVNAQLPSNGRIKGG